MPRFARSATLLCGEQILSTTDGDRKVAVSLRCRSWGCDTCRPARQRQLVAQAISGKPNRFLTLTSRVRPGMTPKEAAQRLVLGWRRFRRQWEQEHKGKRIQFLAVFEATQRGWPHLHVLLRSPYVDVYEISKFFSEFDDSPNVHIQRVVDDGKQVSYCCKYAGKAGAQFGTLKRYWCSQGYALTVFVKDKLAVFWDRQAMNLEAWSAMWQFFGWTVTQRSLVKAEARKPP